jgi:chorismate synthase
MAGNSFGHVFRISTFGESHGNGLGVILDGCPAGLEISLEEIQEELDRRRPGQSELTSPRMEEDKVEILSGVFEGKTLGTPIAMLVRNIDARSEDYESMKKAHRAGHADFTYEEKYGHRDWRGGGRASARETVGRVAAGAIAKKLLSRIGVKISAEVIEIAGDIEEALVAGDSLGGTIEVLAKGVPTGLGEPVFDKLSADLAKALMSIPSARGFELGDGFAAAKMKGSEDKHIGGIMGGISNGDDIVVRLALKPTSSIKKKKIFGRHDACVCYRAVAICEAMAALVLADHYLLSKISKL